MVIVDIPFDVIIIAVLGALLLYAMAQLVHYGVASPLRAAAGTLGGALSGIPIVGGYLGGTAQSVASAVADGLDSAISGAQSYVRSWALTMVKPLAQLVTASMANQQTIWEAATGAIEATAAGIQRIEHVDLPAVSSQVTGVAGTLADQAEGRARTYADQQIAGVFQGLNLILNGQVSNLNGEISGLAGQIAAETGALARELSDSRAAIEAELGAVNGALSSALVAEAQHARAAEAVIAAQAQQEAAAAVQEAERLLGGAVQSLERDYAARDAAIAATAAAATAAVAADFGRFLDECGNDLCEGLGPIAKLLPQLTALFTDGLLLAAVAEAIRDPEGAAEAAVGAVSGAASDSLSFLETLGGLR